MMLRRWESWVFYTRDEQRVGERRLRLHFSKRGAQRWADSLAYSPEALSKSLEGFGRGAMIFANSEVRRRDPYAELMREGYADILDDEEWMRHGR